MTWAHLTFVRHLLKIIIAPAVKQISHFFIINLRNTKDYLIISSSPTCICIHEWVQIQQSTLNLFLNSVYCVVQTGYKVIPLQDKKIVCSRVSI